MKMLWRCEGCTCSNPFWLTRCDFCGVRAERETWTWVDVIMWAWVVAIPAFFAYKLIV